MTITQVEITACLLSLEVASLATLLATPPAILFAYAFAKWDFRGKAVMTSILHLPLAIPPVVIGYFLLLVLGRRSWAGQWLEELFGLQLAFRLEGAVIAAAVISFPLIFRSAYTAFQQLNWEFSQTAKLFGAHWWQSFFRIELPQARNGLSAGIALGFTRALGEFGATMIFAANIPGETQTIPLAIYAASQRIDGAPSAIRLSVLTIIIACVMLYFTEKILGKNPLPSAETSR